MSRMDIQSDDSPSDTLPRIKDDAMPEELPRSSEIGNVQHENWSTKNQIRHEEGVENELVSWTYLKHGTGAVLAYTKQDHIERGLAKAALIHLMHKLHDDQQLKIICIEDVHLRIFETQLQRLGFHYYTTLKNIFYHPHTLNVDSISI